MKVFEMNRNQFNLCMIVVWFGKWPDWIDLFFRSCATNKNIDFLVFTDCEMRDSMLSENIKVEQVSLSDIFTRLGKTVGIKNVTHTKPYKICDFMPIFGLAFKDFLKNYTHWGVCDSDLIFGDLDKFTCRDVDVFSTHAGFISGHFFYVRNNSYNNNAFKSIRGWKSALISDQHYGLNEGSWSNIFIPKSSVAKLRKAVQSLLGRKIKVVAVELFTTPHSAPWTDGTYEYPEYWIYSDGCMVAMNKGVAFEVPYLHFMNWKPGAKYLPRRYEKPLWDGVSLLNCNHIWRDARIKINDSGFSSV